MAKNRTERSPYQSRYGGGWIPGRVRLAEMACERIADGRTLPAFFWRDAGWDKVFRRELSHATRLLASYPIKAIVRAWRSQDGDFLHTLGGLYFRKIVAAESLKLAAEQRQLDMVKLPESVNTNEKPRPMRRYGQSLREKLADAPNEESSEDRQQ